MFHMHVSKQADYSSSGCRYSAAVDTNSTSILDVQPNPGRAMTAGTDKAVGAGSSGAGRCP